MANSTPANTLHPAPTASPIVVPSSSPSSVVAAAAGVSVMSIVSVDVATRACVLACMARSCSSAVSRFVSSPSMRTMASTSVAVA